MNLRDAVWKAAGWPLKCSECGQDNKRYNGNIYCASDSCSTNTDQNNARNIVSSDQEGERK